MKFPKSLFRLTFTQPNLILVGLITLTLGSAINLVIPELIRRYLNHSLTSQIQNSSYAIALILISLFGLQAICFYLRSYNFNLLGHKIASLLRADLFTSLLNKPTEFFDKNASSDLTTRLINDTQAVQDVFSFKISVLIRYGFQVIAGVILMFLISSKLALLIVLAIPLLVLFAFLLGRKLKACSRNLQNALGQSSNIASESLSSIKLVKAFGQEITVNNRFISSNQSVLDSAITRSKVSAFFSSFISFLMNACLVALLVYSLNITSMGLLSTGDLTAFLLYGAIVAVSFSFVVSSYADIMQGVGALSRITELLEDNKAKDASKKETITKPIGTITIEKLSFHYEGRQAQPVLTNINLTCNAKSATALVGPSGAGKSTLASIILGLYPPQSGRILLDGIELSKLDLKWLHSLTAFVPQDPILFNISVKDNILFGNTNAEDQDLIRVCQMAKLDELISRLPQGIDTNCGERGTQLSGGERQRVAIARALIRKPLILVLDEPTSALDAYSESAIQEIISDLGKECTLIVIAHRLSTIKSVNQIVVLQNGQIIQKGTHSSLSMEPGFYRGMLEIQAGN